MHVDNQSLVRDFLVKNSNNISKCYSVDVTENEKIIFILKKRGTRLSSLELLKNLDWVFDVQVFVDEPSIYPRLPVELITRRG